MRDLERWLGDGGMPLIAHLGARFTAYGEGWAEARWEPTPACCNPAGAVQAGVQAVVLDAAMNFALLAGLDAGERVVTVEMKVSNLRAAVAGDRLAVRGEVVRLGQRVGFAEAGIVGEDDRAVARASGTFLVSRRHS